MIICLFLFYFAFGFWFGRTSKQSKKSKFIILACFFVLIVSRETMASESYQCNTDYTIYIPTTDDYQVCNMPPNTFYPDIIYTHRVNTNFTCGNATYQFGQDISTQVDGIYTNIYETKISGGNNAGQIVGYTQEFKFLSDKSDTWESKFYFESKRACSGTVTLYGYINNSWVEVESQSFNTYISYDKIVPDSSINGWKYVVHCTLNSNFTFLRYDDMYADGYTLNQFSWIVRSSQQQQEDTQKSIEENTRNTNTLLGTIKNGIDNIITGIANLPQTILNGIHSLFVPDDIQDDFEDIMETLHDDLGVLALPIDFIHAVCSAITDTTTTVFPVHTPAFKYDNKTIFPAYDRSNILYFGSLPVFGNVGASTWFDNLMSKVGINRSMTIMQCIQAFMKLIIFIGIIRYIYNIVYEYYHMDFDDEVGGADL